MNTDCFYCMWYLLMVLTFLNMALGLTLLGASVWVVLHGAKMGQVFADTAGFNYILYFLMILGTLKFFVGIVGCSSVAKKSSRMLSTFFALVLVVFLGQVAAGIWLYVDEDKVTSTAANSLANFVQKDYETNGYDAKTNALNVLQSKLKCCGSNGPEDWSTSVYNEANATSTLVTYMVPTSCCISNDTTFCDVGREISGDIIEGTIYKEGCVNRVFKEIYAYGGEIGGVIGGVMLIELFVMTSTLVLCRSQNVRYSLY